MSNPTRPKVHVPLAGRTFERTQGCWNCKHFADPEASLKHWREVARPREDIRIREAKLKVLEHPPNPAAVARLTNTERNALCPCGSGKKYKRCHLHDDEAAAAIVRVVQGIEMATAHLDRFERSITQGDDILGSQGLCTNRFAPEGGGFKSDKFLCDRWSAAQGASVARGGQKLDDLPDELKDKIGGDGN